MKIHFYHPFLTNELINEDFNPEIGLDHWITTTFIHLKKYYSELTIGNSIPEKGIIFFHKRYFPNNIKPLKFQFFVCLQVDCGKNLYAQWHIVHNPYQDNILYFPKLGLDVFFGFCKTKYLNGWSQFKLIKREKKRRDYFKTISFHGNVNNIPHEILSDDFQLFLNNNELKFIVKSDSNSWADFHDTDLTMCIRSFNKKKYYTKPFLKITNSLLAGVPVISGPDSSSIYFKNKFVSIPIVNNITELKQYILRLIVNKDELDLQLKEFNKHKIYFEDEYIEKDWLSIIELIKIDYKKWILCSNYKRNIFFTIRYIFRSKIKY